MKPLKQIRLLAALLLSGTAAYAQEEGAGQYSLSLREALAMARQNNKSVQVSGLEEEAAAADYRDAQNSILPTLNAGGTYQRYSRVNLYQHGLNESTVVRRQPGPESAALGVDLAMNLYSGGRTKAIIEENRYRRELARVNSEDQQGSISLQAAVQYLDLVRLYHFRGLLEDQQKRAETRLRTITSFYQNQRVTKSDLLRAEVALSNVLLGITQNENDILIGNRKLRILLNIADEVMVKPTDSLLGGSLQELVPDTISGAAATAYAFQKVTLNRKIQAARIKNLRSNYYPSLSVFSAYGFNYPNYLFFRPIDQIYSVGFVGLRLNYTISSVYQNRHKVRAARERLSGTDLQREYLREMIEEDIAGLKIKYREALNRIAVTEKSIEQSRVNFEIINTKYSNQLALLTDLLDADNLYQESRYSNINAQIGALIIYYRLLYTTGNL